MASRARFIATWVIQAEGFAGMPPIDQERRARSMASWATSSASVRLWKPTSRTSAPWRRPVSWRKKCSTNPEGLRTEGAGTGSGTDIGGTNSVVGRYLRQPVAGSRRDAEMTAAGQLAHFNDHPVGEGRML